MMREGLSAKDALDKLIAADPDKDVRQVGAVDARGGVGAYSGGSCLAWAGHHVGEGYCCQGNILYQMTRNDSDFGDSH